MEEVNGDFALLHLKQKYFFDSTCIVFQLERRLRGRQTETEESIQKRLSVAASEIEYGDTPGNFDLIIVNDDVEAAGNKMKEFIQPYVEELQQE